MPNVVFNGKVYEYTVVKTKSGIRAVTPVDLSASDYLIGDFVKARVAEKEGILQSQVLFENACSENPVYQKSGFESDEEFKTLRALNIVNAFLARYNITPRYRFAPEVEYVMDPSSWSEVVLLHRGLGYCEADSIEGITPPRGGPGREISTIYINGRLYTVGAVVHELFHSRSHEITDSALKAGGDLGEGMTEYLTCLACDLYLRKDGKGNVLYRKQLFALRDSVKSQDVTLDDIIDIYFHGNEGRLKNVDKSFSENFYKYVGSKT